MADLEQHAARIAELMQQLESGAEPQTRERVFELLEHIDHLHRTCVWRLFELVTELGGKGLIDRVAADPVVKTLFVLYDLIPSDPLRPVVSCRSTWARWPGGRSIAPGTAAATTCGPGNGSTAPGPTWSRTRWRSGTA
jgi:hypothetical protein